MSDIFFFPICTFDHVCIPRLILCQFVFTGHIAKECPNLSSTKIVNEADAKKTKPIKKRKAENESKTLPIKKSKKVEHSRKIVKQKAHRSNKRKERK